jgi:hypothetical protein
LDSLQAYLGEARLRYNLRNEGQPIFSAILAGFMRGRRNRLLELLTGSPRA